MFNSEIEKTMLNFWVWKKRKMKGLDGLVADSGKNRVAHDAVYAVFAVLFCLVNLACCN